MQPDARLRRVYFDLNVYLGAGKVFVTEPRWPSIPPRTPDAGADCLGAVADAAGDWALWTSEGDLELLWKIAQRDFDWDRDDASEYVDTIADIALASGGQVLPRRLPKVARGLTGDREDDWVVSLADHAQADLLVTDDHEHILPLGGWHSTIFVTAQTFAERVAFERLQAAPDWRRDRGTSRG